MTTNTSGQDSKIIFSLVTIAILAIVAMVAYHVMSKPDTRTLSERFGDAFEQVGEGDLDDAAEQMQDRTPAQKLGDAVEDAGDEARESVN